LQELKKNALSVLLSQMLQEGVCFGEERWGGQGSASHPNKVGEVVSIVQFSVYRNVCVGVTESFTELCRKTCITTSLINEQRHETQKVQ
jgi:hypothetical protein